MQKDSTHLKKTDLNVAKKGASNPMELKPKSSTLENILQFSATYRVQKITENQYVEMFLN